MKYFRSNANLTLIPVLEWFVANFSKQIINYSDQLFGQSYNEGRDGRMRKTMSTIPWGKNDSKLVWNITKCNIHDSILVIIKFKNIKIKKLGITQSIMQSLDLLLWPNIIDTNCGSDEQKINLNLWLLFHKKEDNIKESCLPSILRE